MKTVVYMVRHGESPKNDRNERTRGLTAQGMLDAHQIMLLLKNEAIDFLRPHTRDFSHE